MNWWEIIGWTGSVLVVVSLMIPSVRRFRILNLTGSLIATIYNIYFGIWPYAAMNGVIVGIDAYWLIRLSQRKTTPPRGYAVVNAQASDPSLNISYPVTYSIFKPTTRISHDQT